MFSLGKQIPYISACVCSELCVRLRLTVCRCRPCFVFYALSKERSSLSQHKRTHTIASQLSFASQLPMGYPPPPPRPPPQHAPVHKHTHTTLFLLQLCSELTSGLAHSQNRNTSYTRRQTSVSSGRVCV